MNAAAMDSGVSEGGVVSPVPAGDFTHQNLEHRLLSRLSLEDQGDAARAAAENALQAFHHHELNETNARLEAAARENSRRLAELVKKASMSLASAPAKTSAAPKSDQLTFDDLMRLYQEDRARRPDHWDSSPNRLKSAIRLFQLSRQAVAI